MKFIAALTIQKPELQTFCGYASNELSVFSYMNFKSRAPRIFLHRQSVTDSVADMQVFLYHWLRNGF
jgi:hypothetical protein